MSRSVSLIRISLALALFLVWLPLGRAATEGQPLETVGLYIWRDTPQLHDFWKDCGYNRMQFCDTAWHRNPDQHAEIFNTIAKELAAVKSAGFKTDVILFSNIVQWKGPGPTGPDVGDRFNPRDKRALEDRLGFLRKTVQALKSADGFTFFAGDPGGVPPEIGTATVQDWQQMARSVQQIIKQEAPAAEFNINTWAISQWKDFGVGAWDLRFWNNDNEITADVLKSRDFVGPNCGIQFPLHNYYRSLALAAYASKGKTPTLYPTRDDVTALRKRGTTRLWGWPYFLVDEADDGYLGSVWCTRNQAQSETRYIHQLVSQARDLGLNGLIANFSYAGNLAEVLNTYAFARFALDPSATPQSVIDQFAAIMATPATAPRLAAILRFIENHSTWQDSLPAQYRLPNFASPDLQSAWTALLWLKQIAPNPRPGIRLPESPEAYLERLRQRLALIAASEKTPESSALLAGGGERFYLSGGNWAGDETTSGGDVQESGSAADRAAIAVSSVKADGVFPMRFELPVELRHDHPVGKLRITYLKNNEQTNAGSIYWDDQHVGTLKAYSDAPSALATAEFSLDRKTSPTLNLSPGIHVLRVQIAEPAPDGALISTFKIDALDVAP